MVPCPPMYRYVFLQKSSPSYGSILYLLFNFTVWARLHVITSSIPFLPAPMSTPRNENQGGHKGGWFEHGLVL